MLTHQKLRDLVISVLMADPPVSQEIRRNNSRPIPTTAVNGVSVRVIGGPGKSNLIGENAPMDWTATVSIVCVARASASMAADEAVSPLLSSVYKRITTDLTIAESGFKMGQGMQIVFDEDELDDRIGSVDLRLTYSWRCFKTDLERIWE